MAKPTKMYYSITEVAELTGLKAHILRYWETEFNILHPKKNRAGNRAYKVKDIETVKLIKRLLHEERYTINGAKQKIKQLRQNGYKPGQPIQTIDFGKKTGKRGAVKKQEVPDDIRKTLKEIRTELREILSMLG